MIIYNEEIICTFCNNKFTYTAVSSYTQASINLDFKPTGAMNVPDFLPVCPECKYPFKEE